MSGDVATVAAPDLISLERFLSEARKLSVLVVGHDYALCDRVDFLDAGLNAYHRIRDKSDTAASISSELVVCDFGRGRIDGLVFAGDQIVSSTLLSSFAAPTSQCYALKKGHPCFTAHATRTLSIQDVYTVLFSIGSISPRALRLLIFCGHGCLQGPILLNSFDPHPHLPWRSPADKDARIKDLVEPQLGLQQRSLLRAAFHPLFGVSVNLGCARNVAAEDVFKKACEIKSMPRRDFGASECDLLRGLVDNCWSQYLANATDVPCYGAFPGMYTSLELGRLDPTLAVPTSAVLDRFDFTEALLNVQRSFGCVQDPWGLGLVRFDPKAIPACSV